MAPAVACAVRFFLGVGAQKSGTSWLYDYLQSFPNVDFGALKEYHVWDALHLDVCQHRIIRPGQVVAHDSNGHLVPLKSQFLRYQMQQRSGAYAEYFRNLIAGNVNSTGDITPSYMGLSAEILSRIRSQLEDVGFEVKPILLMRDPFERCWSAVRMLKRHGKANDSDEAVLAGYFATPECVMRTNYRHAIASLEQAFTPSEIHLGIYEEMHTPHRLQQLSEFCGVASDESHTSKKVHASPKTEEVSQHLKRQILDYYAGVYDYCQDRFPQTRTLWSRQLADGFNP